MFGRPPARTSIAFTSPLLPTETAGPEETVELGRRLAAGLAPGDVLALYGDLGAGKTQLVKGIAAGLGLDPGEVASPTFVLVHEYPTDAPIYHFDAYRIERPAEFTALGFEDYASRDGICVVEWPERVEELLPPGTIRLRLVALQGDRRRVEVGRGVVEGWSGGGVK
jgi:tRNA threonylcarbamoyladenosine biosynthesis protein TsaE